MHEFKSTIFFYVGQYVLQLRTVYADNTAQYLTFAKLPVKFSLFKDAGIAQLVEQLTCNQ